MGTHVPHFSGGKGLEMRAGSQIIPHQGGAKIVIGVGCSSYKSSYLAVLLRLHFLSPTLARASLNVHSRPQVQSPSCTLRTRAILTFFFCPFLLSALGSRLKGHKSFTVFRKLNYTESLTKAWKVPPFPFFPCVFSVLESSPLRCWRFSFFADLSCRS